MKYTKEMEEQDLLWENEKEDLGKMGELQLSIVEEYKKTYNLPLYYLIEIMNGESVVTLYFNMTKEDTQSEDFDFADYYESETRSDGKYAVIVGNCRNLIKELDNFVETRC